MTDLNPNRVATGKAGAGRFDHKYNTEAEVDLVDPDSDEAYNADGSWFFPPKPRSGSQSVAFWEKSKVPDEVLHQFIYAYKDRYLVYSNDRWREEMGKWADRYRESNPEPVGPFGGSKKNWDADFHEAYKEAEDSIILAAYSERPNMISRYDARPLARAAQMYMFAPSQKRYPEEWEKAMNHKVELFDETLTVYEVEQKYRLSEVSLSLTEIAHDSSKQEDLMEEVGSVKNSLEEMNTNYINILEALSKQIAAR
jgi:hypothetical protein